MSVQTSANLEMFSEKISTSADSRKRIAGLLKKKKMKNSYYDTKNRGIAYERILVGWTEVEYKVVGPVDYC